VLGVFSLNLALAFMLCVIVIALGMWLLGVLFPSPKDEQPRLKHNEHIQNKEKHHVERN